MQRVYWPGLIAGLLTTKLLLLVADSAPMFYMGDSGAYIATAVDGYVPPDRSALYGLIIRYTAGSAHSLSSLLLLQVLASVAAALCLAVILARYFGAGPGVVAGVSLIACFEPLQLMMERYVMTESLGVAALAVLTLIVVSYLSRPSWAKVLLLQSSGLVLIALRVSYLPVVQVMTLLVPLLAYLHWRGSGTLTAKRYGAHALASIAAFALLHGAYQHAMGAALKQPPAYQYAGGLFALAAFAPLLKAEDFPDPELGRRVTAGLDLEDLDLREAHRWYEGMLVDRLQTEIPDMFAANRVALRTTANVIKRDPVGPFVLGFRTWLGFYDLDRVRAQALADRSTRPLPDRFLQTLRQHFALAAEDLPKLHTLSNAVWLNATYWYVFLVSVPVLVLAWLPFRSARDPRIFALWVIACGLLAAATIPVTLVSIRYLVPLGWIGLLLSAIFVQRALMGGTRRDHVSTVLKRGGV